MINMLDGKKTYLTGAVMIGIYVLQNFFGVHVPTIDANASGSLLLQGLGLIFGRSAIAKVEKS